MRKTLILVGLFLEGMLVVTMTGWLAPALAQQQAPDALSAAVMQGLPGLSESLASVSYTRIQTVTIQAPSSIDIYATVYTTTFQFEMLDYNLSRYVRVPDDAVVYEASCFPENPPCDVIWDLPTHSYIFSGTGKARVYLYYDTWEKATRSPDSPFITLQYPVGPNESSEDIQLTNTVRSDRFDPQLVLQWAEPPGYNYYGAVNMVVWVLPSTPRITFTVVLTEPVLGSDLVVDRLEMSPESPRVGEMVYYTAAVRNQGAYATGKAVLAELLVRPYALGAPVVLTDHIGGWYWEDQDGAPRGYGMDALFKWYGTASQQAYLPPVMGEYPASPGTPVASAENGFSDSPWYSGVASGEVIIGTTAFPWPGDCSNTVCAVWAKVDPSYLALGEAYEWYGYNPEGLYCQLAVDGRPACQEELNNIREGAVVFPNWLVYLPEIMRSW